MRSALLLVGAWLSLGVTGANAATIPHYINTAPLNGRTPNIDAVAFENRSDFNVFTGDNNFPYQTYNTLNFTNTTLGVMFGTPGFWFDHSYAGGRNTMSNWVNRGLIGASSTIWVDSANIVSTGPGLIAGPRGAILLSGRNINLSRSGLFTGDNALIPGVDLTQFFDLIPDRTEPGNILARQFSQPRIRDSFGAFTRSNSIPKASISNPTQTPNTGAFVFTNRVDTTNFIQAVFVPTNNLPQGVSIDVRFAPGGVGNGSVVMIEISAPEFNIVDGSVTTNYFYLEDWLGFEDDIFHLAKNRASAANEPAMTSRPNNYITRRVSGAQLDTFLGGTRSNFTFASDLFTHADYLSNNVARRVTGYGGQLVVGENIYKRTVQTAADRPWNGLPIEDATNFAGRIEISGDKVNLNQVRLRANSAFILKTPNLEGNQLPIVDAPLLSYDIKSTQPSLTASNLIPPSVTRFLGSFQVNSAIWLNAATNGATNFFYFHTVELTHSITTTQQVLVQDLHLRSPSVQLADTALVTRSFKVEAENFTVTPTGALTNGTSADFGSTNLIGIKNFTNNGTFAINRELRLGSDRPTPYETIVNRSNLIAGSMFLSANRISNAGLIQSTAGSIDINGGVVDLSSSNSIVSIGEVILRGKSLVASNSQILASSGGLVLDFTESAVDAGVNSSNVWRVNDGFSINRVAKTNDLLGTTIISTAANFREVNHYSDAPDLGVNPEGYDNNMAIGRLVLDGGTNTLFRFSPGGSVTNRAFYVDYLQLLNKATNYLDAITVDEGVTLYFADSNIDPSLLNHLQSDRIRWVSSFAGPLSGTNVVYGGGTYALNRRLVLRSDLDSDNDGVANNADSTPVWIPDETANITITTTNLPPIRPLIVWNGLLSQSNVTFVNFVTNVVEYRTSLMTGDWLVLTNIPAPLGPPQFQLMRVVDGSGSNRFYRVRAHVQDP